MFLLLCVVCSILVVSAEPEPPRFQRFRQRPAFFARQEAPYPAAGGNPSSVYGPPPTTTAAPAPKPSYGPPPKPEYGPPPGAENVPAAGNSFKHSRPRSTTIRYN